MTPDQLAKSGSEHAHQTALFAFLAVARLHGFEAAWIWADTGNLPCTTPYAMYEVPTVPALEWVHAIPNGGSRGDDEKSRKIRGAAMKAEGVRQGVADVFLPWPVFAIRKFNGVPIGDKTYEFECKTISYCGLYIEMKKPSEKPKDRKSKGGLSDEQISFRIYAQANSYGWVVCYSWREAAEMIQDYIESDKRNATL